MSHTEGTPSRRGLLTGATAVLVAGTAIATAAHATSAASPEAAGGDAEILRLAGEFWRLDAIIDDWNDDRVPEEVGEEAQDDQGDCASAIADIRATTPEGVRLKADCLLHTLEVCPSSSAAEDHVRAFLAELAGRAAA